LTTKLKGNPFSWILGGLRLKRGKGKKEKGKKERKKRRKGRRGEDEKEGKEEGRGGMTMGDPDGPGPPNAKFWLRA